jgi:hypothetical protein
MNPHYRKSLLAIISVNLAVNNARNEGPQCIEPLSGVDATQ